MRRKRRNHLPSFKAKVALKSDRIVRWVIYHLWNLLNKQRKVNKSHPVRGTNDGERSAYGQRFTVSGRDHGLAFEEGIELAIIQQPGYSALHLEYMII